MYNKGKGIEKNYKWAVFWYKQAADKGNAEAQLNLGIMFKYGRGVEENYTQAVNWFKMSAEQGNVEAQSNLGWMYEYGKGVNRIIHKQFHGTKELLNKAMSVLRCILVLFIHMARVSTKIIQKYFTGIKKLRTWEIR